MTKFKQEVGGRDGCARGVGDETDVSGAAFGLAESEVGSGSPPAAPAEDVGRGDVNADVAVGAYDGAGSSRRGRGQPTVLECVFADLAAASAVLAEHSLSAVLNDSERALIISARTSVDEVLAALAEAAA